MPKTGVRTASYADLISGAVKPTPGNTPPVTAAQEQYPDPIDRAGVVGPMTMILKTATETTEQRYRDAALILDLHHKWPPADIRVYLPGSDRGLHTNWRTRWRRKHGDTPPSLPRINRDDPQKVADAMAVAWRTARKLRALYNSYWQERDDLFVAIAQQSGPTAAGRALKMTPATTEIYRQRLRARGVVPTPLPQYQAVAVLLAQRIADGTYLPGNPLPSEWTLATELRVSRDTVSTAVGVLRKAGVVTSTPRAEHTVADAAEDEDGDRLRATVVARVSELCRPDAAEAATALLADTPR